ncbi:hypothetical protein [Streptomyces griseorubiginosus]|nr:hypothetical protein [Streptomyces griseorubiginosus]WUB48142.1 hypothetical protein OHN19_34305 [Streptomyces griseorubiginosus]WUB56667.1 hypothetical protein OG942_34315 [Streptomyces griseorubiginosus]
MRTPPHARNRLILPSALITAGTLPTGSAITESGISPPEQKN